MVLGSQEPGRVGRRRLYVEEDGPPAGGPFVLCVRALAGGPFVLCVRALAGGFFVLCRGRLRAQVASCGALRAAWGKAGAFRGRLLQVPNH
jgi:hypothetical protein